VLIAYNFVQVIFSAWLFYEVTGGQRVWSTHTSDLHLERSSFECWWHCWTLSWPICLLSSALLCQIWSNSLTSFHVKLPVQLVQHWLRTCRTDEGQAPKCTISGTVVPCKLMWGIILVT
jgi:hypothetical protein